MLLFIIYRFYHQEPGLYWDPTDINSDHNHTGLDVVDLNSLNNFRRFYKNFHYYLSYNKLFHTNIHGQKLYLYFIGIIPYL
jgi:hypothetical protein